MIIRLKHPMAELFRHYNVIDYKSPDDYISLDDFDRILAYTRLHHLLKESKEDLWYQYTITCICSTYPKAMISKIKRRGIRVEDNKPIHGIYQIHGEMYPLQIIVLNRMNNPEHLWPFSLYLSQERRKKSNAFINLMNHKVKNPYDNDIKDVIDFIINNKLFSYNEWEEVMRMSTAEKFTKDEIRKMINLMDQLPITIEWYEKLKEEAMKDANNEVLLAIKLIKQGAMDDTIQKTGLSQNTIHELRRLLS